MNFCEVRWAEQQCVCPLRYCRWSDSAGVRAYSVGGDTMADICPDAICTRPSGNSLPLVPLPQTALTELLTNGNRALVVDGNHANWAKGGVEQLHGQQRQEIWVSWTRARESCGSQIEAVALSAVVAMCGVAPCFETCDLGLAGPGHRRRRPWRTWQHTASSLVVCSGILRY